MGKFGIVVEGLAVTEEERARKTGCTGRIPCALEVVTRGRGLRSG
jgi:hypothetical protein